MRLETLLNFNPLRRSLQTALLLSFTLIAAAPAPAQTVVVTGIREPIAADRLVADVAVIDTDTLRFTLADSLADVLRREAGLQLSRSGGPGQSSGLLIRGAASQQSLVLVDGVRVGSATLGYAAVESLGLAQVERIEVLRGPGSSLYGADAVGGVVNLITRRGQGAPRFDGRVALGGYGSREASAGVRGAQGTFDYAAVLSSERSEGVSALRPNDQFGNHNPDRDGFRLDAAQLRLGLSPTAGQRLGLTLLQTRLNAQYDASEFLPPTYAQDASPDFRNRQRTEVAALDWRGRLEATLEASARVSRSVDDARSGGIVTDHFRTLRQHASAQIAWLAGEIGRLVVAAEHQQDEATSTSYAASARRRNNALALELTGAAGPWVWQGDLRRDDSSDFGGVTTARAGGSLMLAPGLRLRALAGNTFRAPSFNDLVYPGYGVPTLQPERGQSVEAGLVWRTAGSDVSATVYRNRVRDLIGYESNPARCPNNPGYAFGCAANINRAQLQGATLTAQHRAAAWLLKAQLDHLKARDQNTGAPLPRRAAQQATLAAEWTAGDWSAAASVLHLGQRPDGGKTLAAQTTLDLGSTWRLASAWSLQAKLLNATDRDLEPVRDYQGPGRQAWLVLRYEPRP